MCVQNLPGVLRKYDMFAYKHLLRLLESLSCLCTTCVQRVYNACRFYISFGENNAKFILEFQWYCKYQKKQNKGENQLFQCLSKDLAIIVIEILKWYIEFHKCKIKSHILRLSMCNFRFEIVILRCYKSYLKQNYYDILTRNSQYTRYLTNKLI